VSLINFIIVNLKNLQGASASAAHKELAEQAASVVAQENIELACAFIQKTAIEKAIIEIDKRLANVRN